MSDTQLTNSILQTTTLASTAADWYVVGGSGDDTLTGGEAGAFVDGGGGNDTILVTNGTTILSQTYHGGQDTLVLPEGITPENLRFFRILNPLQANAVDIDPTAPRTAVQQLQYDALISKDTSVSSLLPDVSTWLDTSIHYPSDIPHFDTLRVQSTDGTFTFDIVGYFEQTTWKNEIVFTSVLDANGNPKSYSIDSLLQTASEDAVLPMHSGYAPYGWTEYRGSVQGGSDPFNFFVPVSDGQTVIGGEAGTILHGRTKVTLTKYESDNLSGSPYVYSTFVGHDKYYDFQTNAQLLSHQYLNYQPYSTSTLIEGLPENPYGGLSDPNWSNVAAKSFTLDAFALPDHILGFGGDDTIASGGVYFETYKAGAFPYSFTHTNPAAIGIYGYYDSINGGAGDDTYIVRAGETNFMIIATDELNSGAEGIDTLDLSWLRSEWVNMDFSWDGSGFINYNINQDYDILIEGATNGHLQVDRIKFADKTINVADLILAAPYSYNSYYNSGPKAYDHLDYTHLNSELVEKFDERYWSLSTTLAPNAVVKGSAFADTILAPSSGLVQGAEGADIYQINIDKTEFLVLMMDKNDQIQYGHFWSPDQGFIDNSHQFSFGYNYTHQVQLGKLETSGAEGAQSYSLTNWHAADGSFDDITDALLTWQTKDASGQTQDHYLVLAGYMDATGREMIINPIWSDSLPLSQGSDYFNAKYYDNVHALGGNDTVDASGLDFLENGVWVGAHNQIFGESGDDSIDGGAGNDSLFGGTGQDTLLGGFGDDYLDGGESIDMLYGNDGNDMIEGAGLLDGGDGNDTLTLKEMINTDQASTLRGGNGNDTLNAAGYHYLVNLNTLLDGGTGNDTYYMYGRGTALHRAGDGVDVIGSYSSTSELRMEGLKLSDLLLARTSTWSSDLIVATKSGLHNDQVTVRDYFANATNQLKLSVLNEAGTDYVVVDADTINRLANVANALNNTINGTNNAETLTGNEGNDVLFGEGGNDILMGDVGDDRIYGGAGNDLLLGGAGNDTLWDSTGTDRFEGGAGDDVFYGGGAGDVYDGGLGNDTYHWEHALGNGTLTIIDTDATPGNHDTLVMNANPYSVLFKRVGSDLQIVRMDASETATVKNWFDDTENQIETFRSGAELDNTFYEGTLTNASVMQLVEAMANFNPTAGQTSISEQSNNALFLTIQNAWAVQSTALPN